MTLLFLDVSGGEILVILLLVLLFFGSKGIPDIARTLGRTMRQLRDASNQVQREIQKETNVVKRGFDQQKAQFRIEEPDHRRSPIPAPPTEAPAGTPPEIKKPPEDPDGA
ncbi:MAG: twin-arginine translocase TatA/TatE family subunit [Flavobacteriales bacterium]